MGRGVRLARIGGIDVFLDWSLLIIFFLVTAALGSGLFPQWHPEWNALTTWSTAVGAAVLFFASVLIHELSHAWVGRAQGVDIRRITLFVFGGMAHIEHEPRTWRAEFWMAIVGPFTSLALGIGFASLGYAIGGGIELTPDHPEAGFGALGPVPTLLLWLGPVNVILALFNLAPGFPLDGGRVLRAVIWGMTGDMERATRWASNGGQAFAWLLIVSGLAMALGVRVPVFGTGFINGLWIALIGWFLHNAALMSYRQLLVRKSLENVPVSRLMHSQIQTIGPDMSVADFIDEHLLASDQRAYPVVDDSGLVGLVCLQDVRNVSRNGWAITRIDAIMTPARELMTVRPDTNAFEAMEMLSGYRFNQLPVVTERRVRGLIRPGRHSEVAVRLQQRRGAALRVAARSLRLDATALLERCARSDAHRIRRSARRRRSFFTLTNAGAIGGIRWTLLDPASLPCRPETRSISFDYAKPAGCHSSIIFWRANCSRSDIRAENRFSNA